MPDFDFLHNIDLTSEFLLGTEIAHYKEENETLISSISWNTLLVMATYKKSVTSEHPVFKSALRI